MAHLYIIDIQMPQKYWFRVVIHAVICHNYLPCKVNGQSTSSLELAHGTRPPICSLFRPFSMIYFNHKKDGTRDIDGVAEAKFMQGIVMGQSEKSNAYIVYLPHTKQCYNTVDFTINKDQNTAQAFDRKYDGGIFFGLYEVPAVPQGIEPYPKSTYVIYKTEKGKVVRGYVTSIPKSHTVREVPPTSDELGSYTLHLVNDTVVRVFINPMA